MMSVQVNLVSYVDGGGLFIVREGIFNLLKANEIFNLFKMWVEP
jgi:hypothetical protein